MGIETNKIESNRNGTPPSPRLIDSSQLFGSDNEIAIKHEKSIYRLRITKNGKLIMNK